jgi:hypothetical protein
MLRPEISRPRRAGTCTGDESPRQTTPIIAVWVVVGRGPSHRRLMLARQASTQTGFNFYHPGLWKPANGTLGFWV